MVRGLSLGRASGRGYSMMEVLLALVVISFGLYGLLDLITTTQKQSVRAHRRAVAVELARARMAELQAAGYDAVAGLWAKSSADPSKPLDYPPETAAFAAPYKAKNFRWQAHLVRDAQHPEVIQVEVRVTWDVIPGAPEEKLSASSVAVGGLLVKK